MQVPHKPRGGRRDGLGWIAAILAGVLAGTVVPRGGAQQTQPEWVGTIRVQRARVNRQLLEAATGPVASRLDSGSEVDLGAEYALIELVTGGEIHACGPANFRVLKSGAAVTVAVNSGRLRAKLDGSTPVIFYTPFVTAQPIAIGGDPREVIVGLEAGGAMCVQAARGALRLENQFTGETLVVPQAGEFFLRDGQLLAARQSLPACTCEEPAQPHRVQLARTNREGTSVSASGAEPRQVPTIPLRLVRPVPREPAPEPAAVPQIPGGEPVWTVVMPPLRFDAAEPEPPPETEPQVAILIREVRVQPALIFRGQVDTRAAATGPRESSRSENPVGKFFRWLLGMS
jgi:hypothetical protein